MEAEPLAFYRMFDRHEPAPRTDTATFTVDEALVGKQFHLIVVNGDEVGGEFRASSGRITLNGMVVSPPSDFSPQRDVWSVPVTLQAENTLSVRLEGNPKGRIGIAIEHD